jgi:L-asparaginase
MTDKQKKLDHLLGDMEKGFLEAGTDVVEIEQTLDTLKRNLAGKVSPGGDAAQQLSRIYVLYTGGTFGMKKATDIPGNPLIPMALGELKQMIPRSEKFVKNTYVHIDSFTPTELLDSSSMTPDDWLKIASKIEDNYNDYDGFVIIQGTDTLSYTSSALSFMFENLAKPVVITGSQLPLLEERTDAKLNYGHALQVAASAASGLPHIPEVVVVFADRILRGCRTRKMSASSWTGFDTPNCPPLGEIGEHVRIFENQIRPAPPTSRRFRVNKRLKSDVIDIGVFPGLRASTIKALFDAQQGENELAGLILRTYGTGNAPEDAAFLHTLSQAINEQGKVVVNITQCPQGMVEMGLYAASVGLLDAGVISGLDMTPEAALTKMMVTLGTNVGDQVKLQMQIDQRGEQSQSLFDLSFPLDSFSADGEPVSRPYSQFAQPDGRFNSIALSNAVLRIDGLQVEMGESKEGFLAVFMNFPSAQIEDIDDELNPNLILKIPVGEAMGTRIVEQLSKDQVKDIIGDSVVTLTFVPSNDFKFAMSSLSMSLFVNT